MPADRAEASPRGSSLSFSARCSCLTEETAPTGQFRDTRASLRFAPRFGRSTRNRRTTLRTRPPNSANRSSSKGGGRLSSGRCRHRERPILLDRPRSGAGGDLPPGAIAARDRRRLDHTRGPRERRHLSLHDRRDRRRREVRGFRLSAGTGLGGLVLETGHAEWTDNYLADERFTHSPRQSTAQRARKV